MKLILQRNAIMTSFYTNTVIKPDQKSSNVTTGAELDFFSRGSTGVAEVFYSI